jgi:ParB-like chromosome segregation protein Spo0J
LSKEEEKELRRSIIRFGLIDKPIITKGGIIIGGHQRVKVCQELGWTQIECWVIDGDRDFNERMIDELNIRLNRNTGDWDWDKLANEWDTNLLCEWGFNPDDFEDPLPKDKIPKVIFEFEEVEDVGLFLEAVNVIKFPGKYKTKVKK